jgi:GTP-binding protein
VARTSAAPGKTRLANVYRLQRSSALYVVDLPGYGYARGDADDFRGLATQVVERVDGAILVVDARHPGLENDRNAWRWLTAVFAGGAADRRVIAANKIDKLSRAERLRAIREMEAVFDHPVIAISAETGEGLDELWKLINRLNSSNRPPRHPRPLPPNQTAAEDSPRRRRHPKN